MGRLNGDLFVDDRICQRHWLLIDEHLRSRINTTGRRFDRMIRLANKQSLVDKRAKRGRRLNFMRMFDRFLHAELGAWAAAKRDAIRKIQNGAGLTYSKGGAR